MTREEARKAAEVMLAYAEGKTIQQRRQVGYDDEWFDVKYPSWEGFPFDYLLKPESTYRPFKTKEECWEEMLKHQPFGFIKNINTQEYDNVVIVYTEENNPYVAICKLNGIVSFHTDYMFLCYTFADGTPFGIKGVDND